MKTPAPADLQRWSDEVARDPRSLAFLPLARAYRRQGLRDAALQLCLRGLESYPEHVEAHSLLALLHLEGGDHQKAADEWSVVLRLEPDNFDALRGMGFWCFERDQLSRARDLLERAAALRPSDAMVHELLNELGTREELRRGLARGVDASFSGDRTALPAAPAGVWEQEPIDARSPRVTEPNASGAPSAGRQDSTPLGPPASPGVEQRDDGFARAAAAQPGREAGHAAADAPAPREPPQATPDAVPATVDAAPARALPGGDPAHFFDDLLATGPLLGALLVDAQGLVLAGRLTDPAESDSATLGAVLGNAVLEAVRTTAHLELGNWRGLLIETQHALLHVKPVNGNNALVIAAVRDAPAGWLLRTAAHAAEQAARFVEEYV